MKRHTLLNLLLNSRYSVKDRVFESSTSSRMNNQRIRFFHPPFHIHPKPSHHNDVPDESDNVVKGLLTTLDKDLLLQGRLLFLRSTQNSLYLRII